MISDFIKGKKQFDYPDDVRRGIILHRAIDTFTDNHPANKLAKNIFSPYYRLYSAAFIDVVHDHFLANDKQQFTENSLFLFSQEVYTILDTYESLFPSKFRQMYPYMKQQNWLYNYRNRSGIEQSFGGLVRRASYMSESKTAFMLFENNYRELQKAYIDFFPAVHQFAYATLQSL